MNLSDVRLVVVTGAGSGIGRATAVRFAGLGAAVVCTDINERTAAETASFIEQRGGTAHAYRQDVSDPVEYEALATKIKDSHGVPDLVVNNAGIARVGGTLQHSVQDWQDVLGVDLSGVAYGCMFYGAQMAERGTGGHLVNIASLAAYSPGQFVPSYCSSKAGVRMLSQSLRAELAADRIGVSVICPGGIKTNIYSSPHLGLPGDEAEKRRKGVTRRIALGSRLGLVSPPDKVARAVVRAVRHNWAVVPVQPEAWATYALSRLAPELMRFGSRHLTGDRLIKTLR